MYNVNRLYFTFMTYLQCVLFGVLKVFALSGQILSSSVNINAQENVFYPEIQIQYIYYLACLKRIVLITSCVHIL